MRRGGDELFLFFNERETSIDTTVTLHVDGVMRWIDLASGMPTDPTDTLALRLDPWQSKLLWVQKEP